MHTIKLFANNWFTKITLRCAIDLELEVSAKPSTEVEHRGQYEIIVVARTETLLFDLGKAVGEASKKAI